MGANIFSSTFKTNKQNAMQAAKELGYSRECLDRLRKAETDGDIERIMRDARHGKI